MSPTNQKRLLLNLLLVLAIAGLALFVYTREADTSNQFKTLYDISIGDDAKEIIIQVEGKENLVLQNQNDTWKVVQPVEFIADQAKVQHLFTLLSENAESNYPLEGKDLAEYGLDEEKMSISFNGVKIIFGHLNTVTQQRFIRKGDTLYLINETISGVMQLGAEAFKPETREEFKPVQK